ncbi:MAG: UDP-N-acetylglucosamine 2-epimerase, partial [Phycisphaerales bacterium]
MADHRRTIAVVTGSRADYGLLRPVMRAIHDHADLQLRVIVTGVHLLPPAHTANEVARDFTIANTIAMQRPGECSRLEDAEALGRGVTGFAQRLSRHPVDVVLVLGDRIEALAAAAAASVGGIRVAHLHGGDRAEGIADEAIRHAITKLAH